jgi:hypothetical protein
VIYLTGGINQTIVAACYGTSLGLLLQPAKGNVPAPGIPFAIDNDCFSTLRPFDDDRWLDYLERMMPATADCLFAVAPDVVGNAEATHFRSCLYLDTIRWYGYPVAFVSQDGANSSLIPWDVIDCLFVGGSTAWKFSEPSVALIREAKRRGLWVHVGRVNSLRRMMTAHSVGADSADGTHLAFRPDEYLPGVLRWLDATNAQIPLETVI